MSKISDALMTVKQEVFNEMVEGNGRQPAEVVDQVIYAILDVFPDLRPEYQKVLDFYPDYTGGQNE